MLFQIKPELRAFLSVLSQLLGAKERRAWQECTMKVWPWIIPGRSQAAPTQLGTTPSSFWKNPKPGLRRLHEHWPGHCSDFIFLFPNCQSTPGQNSTHFHHSTHPKKVQKWEYLAHIQASLDLEILGFCQAPFSPGKSNPHPSSLWRICCTKEKFCLSSHFIKARGQELLKRTI